MSYPYFEEETMTSFEAKSEAQKLTFYPIMFQCAKVLRDLGILEYMQNEKRPMEPKEIADHLNLPLYGVTVLLEVGLSIGAVKIDKDHKFRTGYISYFLLNDEQTKVNMDFVHDVCYKGMFDLKEAILNEKPEGLKVLGNWPTIYEGLSQLEPDVQKSWFGFDHYYSDQAFPDALPIVFEKKPKILLDVGGNTGRWAVKCCEYDPDVHVKIVDLPGQWEKAKGNIESLGLADRISGHVTNVLDENPTYPEYADAIWMSQFLDCFSEREIVHILTHAKKAMGPDSSLYILETYWDRQKHQASTYCLHGTSLYFTAMANGNSKMYHSRDLKRCVEEAGLKVVLDRDEMGYYHTLFECKLA